jgi:N-acetylneuraminic acid mutarotase
MHTQNLVQRSVSAIPILVWAGLLALYPAPSWGQDWTMAPPMPTERYSLAAAASPDGQTIYTLGGARNIGFRTISDVAEAYDTKTGTWSSLPEMSFQRFGLAAATDSAGRVYAIGGEVYFGGRLFPEVEFYDPMKGAWTTELDDGTPVAPLPTRRVFLAAATGPDGTIYALGGISEPVTDVFKTVEAYNPSTNTWRTDLAPMPTARGSFAVVTGPDGKLYAMGGFNVDSLPSSNSLDTVEVYDPATDSWSTAAPMLTARRDLAAAVGPDGRIYALGGLTWDGLAYHLVDTVEAYDPVTDSWTTIDSVHHLTPRWGLAAATDADGRIFALGGLGTGILNTVEVYGP